MDKFQTLREKNTPTNNVYPNIQTQNIPDGGVTTAKLATGAVSTAKIADDAVSTTKIASQAVTSAKIASQAVTSGKIATGAVITDKIGDSMITRPKLVDGVINASKISDNSITHSKYQSHSIYGDKISQYSGLIIDFDTGDDFDDLLDWIEAGIKDGCTFYFDDELSGVSQCLLARDGHELHISNPLPLQGYQTSYTIDSSNEGTFFSGDGATLKIWGIFQ